MTEDDRRGLDALVNSLVSGTRDARKDRAQRLLAEPPSPFRPISCSLHVGTTHRARNLAREWKQECMQGTRSTG